MEKEKGRMEFLDLLINTLREHEKKMDEQLQTAKDIVDLLEGLVDRNIQFKADPGGVKVFYPKKEEKIIDTKKMLELYRILEKFFGDGYPG